MAIAMTDRKIRLYHRDDINVHPSPSMVVTIEYRWPSMAIDGGTFFIDGHRWPSLKPDLFFYVRKKMHFIFNHIGSLNVIATHLEKGTKTITSHSIERATWPIKRSL